MKNEGRNRNGNTEMKINGVYSSQNLSHKCSFSIISKISNVIYTLNGPCSMSLYSQVHTLLPHFGTFPISSERLSYKIEIMNQRDGSKEPDNRE